MSGFVADPGTNFSQGDLPTIVKRLDTLAKRLGLTINGISGFRTPAHSVAVGGSANDPHTQAKAIDFGVNGSLRSSAAQISDAELASVGLYRPFPGATEINHVQLDPNSPLNSNLGPDSGGVLGKAAGAISDAGQAIQNAPGDAADALAKKVAKSLWGMVVDSIGTSGGRVLLSIALVIAAVALIGIGASRALGLRRPAQSQPN